MAFGEVVESIYASGADRQRWGTSLALISRHCRARSGLLMVREIDSGRLDFWAEHGLTASYQRPFLQRYRSSDLRLDDLIQQPVGSVRTDTMLPDYAAYKRSPAYQDLYQEMGTEHALGGFVHQDAARGFAVRVFRSASDGPFAADEVSRFRQLAPHLGQAVSLTRRVLQAEARNRLLERLLERADSPVCVLGANGAVLMAGPRGRRLLQSDGGRIHSAVKGAAGLKGGAALAFRSSGGGVVRLEFLQNDGTDGLGGMDLSLWLVRWRDEPLDLPDSGAAARFRLTPAETRLVSALCAGETLASAAERFGVGRETVKSQLRDIFQKTQVRRQADLVRQFLRPVASGPGGIGDNGDIGNIGNIGDPQSQ